MNWLRKGMMLAVIVIGSMLLTGGDCEFEIERGDWYGWGPPVYYEPVVYYDPYWYWW